MDSRGKANMPTMRQPFRFVTGSDREAEENPKKFLFLNGLRRFPSEKMNATSRMPHRKLKMEPSDHFDSAPGRHCRDNVC
jgi:hypothetical protein